MWKMSIFFRLCVGTKVVALCVLAVWCSEAVAVFEKARGGRIDKAYLLEAEQPKLWHLEQ